MIERDDNPKCSVLLKLDLTNAFKSLNRETTLNHVFSSAQICTNILIAPTVKRELLYGNSIIMSEDGNSIIMSPLFAERKHTLVKKKLESKINVCYLDDGNLADDYKILLRDLKSTLKSEKKLWLKSEH